MVSVLGAMYVGQITCMDEHTWLFAKMTSEHRYEQPETKISIKTPIVAQEDCKKTVDTLLNHGAEFHNTDNFIRQKDKRNELRC
jgi:hypothetical protein